MYQLYLKTVQNCVGFSKKRKSFCLKDQNILLEKKKKNYFLYMVLTLELSEQTQSQIYLIKFKVRIRTRNLFQNWAFWKVLKKSSLALFTTFNKCYLALLILLKKWLIFVRDSSLCQIGINLSCEFFIEVTRILAQYWISQFEDLFWSSVLEWWDEVFRHFRIMDIQCDASKCLVFAQFHNDQTMTWRIIVEKWSAIRPYDFPLSIIATYYQTGGTNSR